MHRKNRYCSGYSDKRACKYFKRRNTFITYIVRPVISLKACMRIYIVILFSFCYLQGHSQHSLIVTSGFSIDANRKPGSPVTFTHIPLSLQWLPARFGSRVFPVIKIDYLLPLNKTATDNAYTLNTAVSNEIPIRKTYRPFIFNLNTGMRFMVYQRGRNFLYTDALLTAICHQYIKVSYENYDNDNYEILNPDISVRKTSIGVGLGLVYRRLLSGRSSVLCMLNIQSPPFTSSKVDRYEVSYRFVAPIQFTIGYGFSYKKAK